MSLATNITNLATRVATEAKGLRTLINGNQASLSALTTTDKSNLVAAINELVLLIGGAGAKIDDATVSALSVWSSSKTDSPIDAAVSALVASSPATLDTLNELAAALGDDPNFATSIADALALKAPSANPAFTGTVGVPDNAFAIAKIAGLQAALNGKVTLFTDPNADRILFWDDSASAVAPLTVSGLAITGTNLAPTPASETAAGIVEQASLSEMSVGTDATRYATPQGVRQEIGTRSPTNHTHVASNITDFATAASSAIPAATDLVPGKVELATTVEATTGVDTTRAVTPAGVKAVGDTKAPIIHGHSLTDANIIGVLPIAQVPTGTTGTTVALGNHSHVAGNISDFSTEVDKRINVLVPTSTTTVAGKIELATDIEVAAGSDVSRAVTPVTLRSVMGDPETNYVSVFETALV